jgi:hypothetical protein
VIFTVDVAGLATCVRTPRASDLVDGVGYGPDSSEQPAVAQPAAAGPVKVGEWSPRLEDVTLLVVRVVAAVAAAPPGAVTRAIGKERSATNIVILDRDINSPTFPDAPAPGERPGAGEVVPLRVGLRS